MLKVTENENIVQRPIHIYIPNAHKSQNNEDNYALMIYILGLSYSYFHNKFNYIHQY